MKLKWAIDSTYVYKLEEDFLIYLPELKGINIKLPYVSVSDGLLKIHKDYAWNGCTPKFKIFGLKIIGTSDGTIDYATGKPLLYYASLVHDALYQYQVIDRKKTDKIFLRLMNDVEFFLANEYYYAVRLFGKRWKITG